RADPRGLRALEVGGVGGHVRAGGHPVAASLIVAGAEELHRVGDDLDALPLGPVLGLPFAPVQTPLDPHRPTLGEVGGAVLPLSAPNGDVEVVRFVHPVAAGCVLATTVDGDAEFAHGRPARQAAELRV